MMLQEFLDVVSALSPIFVMVSALILLVTAIHLSRTSSDLLEIRKSIRSLPPDQAGGGST